MVQASAADNAATMFFESDSVNCWMLAACVSYSGEIS